MNFVLAKVGYAGTGSDAARSFASYGRRISSPRIGAIAVLTRGRNGGHVGVVSGIDPEGNPIIISGNHNRSVGEARYPRSRVIAYVMPTDEVPADRSTAVASRAEPARASAAEDDSIPSPITELLAAINKENPGAPSQPPAQRQAPPVTMASFAMVRPGVEPADRRAAPQPTAIPATASQRPPVERIVQQMPDAGSRPTAQRLPYVRDAGDRRGPPIDPALARFLGMRTR